MSYTVYTKPSCKYCVLLKNFLTRNNITYTEIDLSDAKTLTTFKQIFPNVSTVPFIIDNSNNTPIGGYEEFLRHFNT